MWHFIWPIALVVLANVLYQICAKSVPDKADPFAALTVTYLVGALFSTVLYLVRSRGGNILRELAKMNWAPYLLGLVIVGLEVGFIYAYQAGWEVSRASVVQSSLLAVILVAVGFLLYKEPVTWNKVAGVLVCLGGLALINLK